MRQPTNGISIGSAVFITAHPCSEHTDTDHATYDVCSIVLISCFKKLLMNDRSVGIATNMFVFLRVRETVHR